MYINYNTVKGSLYATLTTSVRSGNKVGKGEQIYLGRVIDKEKGIFKSRDRGIYTYDIKTNTYGSVPADYQEPVKERHTKYPKRPLLAVSFGDIYFMDQYIRKSGFIKAVDATGFRNPDTLHALLLYYLLCSLSNCHAEDWWNLTYAKYLYPKAQMSSQRISDALKDLGSEDAKRQFFKEYFSFLEHSSSSKKTDIVGIDDGILIDSTGLPNTVQIPETAVSNHNHVISEEIRLVYVVQQKTGMPLFFRYVAGNVIDVSTITRTIAELKANGINTKFAILDAGYYTGVNADALLDAGVSFISRMKSNFKVYKRVAAENLASLECRDNLVMYNKRIIYVKCVPCMIGKNEDRAAYAYLCKDMAMQHVLEKDLIARAEDQGLTNSEIFDEMQTQGVFVLISSRRIAKDKLLPLYYTRDRIEKIFELCKSGGKALPLNIESEATLQGHLLMTFMATVLLKMMSDKLKKTELTVDSMLMILHEQHALIYDDEFIVNEAVRKMNEAYQAFKIPCPTVIPRKANNVD